MNMAFEVHHREDALLNYVNLGITFCVLCIIIIIILLMMIILQTHEVHTPLVHHTFYTRCLRKALLVLFFL